MMKKLFNNGTVWALTLVVVRTIIAFVSVPIVTKATSVEAYGFVALANSFIAYIDIIAVSFNYFAQRYISVCFHKSEYEQSRNYYSSIIFADIILCIVSSIPIFLFIYKAETIINIPNGLLSDVKWLFVFLILKYDLSLFSATFEVGAFIKNRVDLTSKIRVVACLLQFSTLCVLFILREPKIYYVGIAAIAYEIFNFIFQLWAKNYNVSLLTFSRKNYSFGLIKNLVEKGIWVSINNFGNILNNGLDLLITNLMISEITQGIISIAKMLSSLNYAVVSAVSDSLKPAQLKFYSEGKTNLLINELNYAMKITGTLYIIVIGAFVGCGKEFLVLWLGNTNEIRKLYLFTILCLLGDLIPSVMKPLYYTYTLTAKMKFPCFVTIIMGLANVISMYILIANTNMGGAAVLLTTVVINTIHIIDSPIYSAYCLKIQARSFYKTIGIYIFTCALMISIAMGFSLIEASDSVIIFLIKVILFSITCMLGSYIVMFNKNEKIRLRKEIMREME
ncbi:lipopolysaccharide biosynthesis protein [Butyrivibrio sp. INlla16]|uniref:lipopolysaccharide biosynthesis protein n=1 Tax=Butyrivibrio sp. INlla16 TaxID=1520807 RepID=UPI00087EF2BA|nr:lipopolysaccharide biosynthesis protein [Butyrivibrio sp. INlla16]SDB09715.1 Membrane protein involved in the export of O-antigen and teichoic acid [Butyrivibrio sp. INlla16]